MNRPEPPGCGSAPKHPSHPHRQARLRRVLLGAGLAAVVVAWFYREPLRNRIEEEQALASNAPGIEEIDEVIEKAPDPRRALLSAWRTGRIVPREAALGELSRVVPPSSPLPANLQTMLWAAALDPDNDVRELAFGILENRKDSALPALAMAQLNDPDPEIQLLGLDHLNHVRASLGVPLIIPILEKPDLRVVATGLKILEKFSDQSFAVKLSDTVPIDDPKSGLQEFTEAGKANVHAGVERAKLWWTAHHDEFKPVHLEVPPAAFSALQPMLARDFQLPGLDGKSVRLSQFRGKMVLLNFWTTWCPSCLTELPALVALQKQYGSRLAVLGISLDSPDDENSPGADRTPGGQRRAFDKVRQKVQRLVTARAINYTVLLDEKDLVGARFNGGELPTTVILDAQGRVRRRFVGSRSLAVFEAMIAEL